MHLPAPAPCNPKASSVSALQRESMKSRLPMSFMVLPFSVGESPLVSARPLQSQTCLGRLPRWCCMLTWHSHRCPYRLPSPCLPSFLSVGSPGSQTHTNLGRKRWSSLVSRNVDQIRLKAYYSTASSLDITTLRGISFRGACLMKFTK